MDGIKNPIRLRRGRFDGQDGVYWAWPVDGYYDLHHAPEGVDPDGSDVVEELLPTLAAARAAARGWHGSDDTVAIARLFGLSG